MSKFNIEDSGIYKIISKKDGKYYPGSSQHMLRGSGNRKYQHFYQLRKNKHWCNHLQHAYNLYGESNFEFIIIKNNIPIDQLFTEEQKLLDIAKTEPEKCYTNNFRADRPEITPEIRIKLSIANRGKIRSQKHKEILKKINTGKKYSHETNQKKGSSGHIHPLFDHTIYKFQNRITNEIFIGTRFDFRHKFNLNKSAINQLIWKDIHSAYNWILI